MVCVWSWHDLGMVLEWFAYGLGMVWVWSWHVLDMVCTWLEYGLDMVWHGYDMVRA